MGDLDGRLTRPAVTIERQQTCRTEPLEDVVDGRSAVGETIEFAALHPAARVAAPVADRDESGEQPSHEWPLVHCTLVEHRLRPSGEATFDPTHRVVGVDGEPVPVTTVAQFDERVLQ